MGASRKSILHWKTEQFLCHFPAVAAKHQRSTGGDHSVISMAFFFSRRLSVCGEVIDLKDENAGKRQSEEICSGRFHASCSESSDEEQRAGVPCKAFLSLLQSIGEKRRVVAVDHQK